MAVILLSFVTEIKTTMKFSRFIPLIFLLYPLVVGAQNVGTSTPPKTRFVEKLAFKADYFGELVLHPGFSAGLDYTLLSNKWTTLHWDADLGGFWHRWNNTSAFLKTSIGSRFAMGPAFADINLGVGYMHTWAAGEVYQRAENGSVEKVTQWGTPHFMPNASLLFGWDGSRKSNLPWTVHIGPEIYLQSSFNHSFLPHLAVKIGFTYKINTP